MASVVATSVYSFAVSLDMGIYDVRTARIESRTPNPSAYTVSAVNYVSTGQIIGFLACNYR
jgi:hypothetical protein